MDTNRLVRENYSAQYILGNVASTFHACQIASFFTFLLLMKRSEYSQILWFTSPQTKFQILDKSDYTLISGNPYIKKSGPYFYATVTVSSDNRSNYHPADFSNPFQGGEKYHASSISHLKSRTTPLSLMTAAMSTVLNFLFERLCSMSFYMQLQVILFKVTSPQYFYYQVLLTLSFFLLCLKRWQVF